MQTVRVATWNLWWRFGDWRVRQVLITDTLAALEADVIALQEVWRSPERHQAEELAAALGMHVAWAPSPRPDTWQDRIGDPSVDYGNAVLSRWPLREQHVYVLPGGPEEDHSRTLLACDVDTPAGSLPFFTTQLTSAPHASSTRLLQVEAIARYIADWIKISPTWPLNSSNLSPILTGDLNAEADSDELRRLCGHKTEPAAPPLVFVDAWRYADASDAGWTWTLRNPHLTGMGIPNARIDYVLVGLPRGRGCGDVSGVGLAGHADEPNPAQWPSDHLAVWADVRLRSSPGRAERVVGVA